MAKYSDTPKEFSALKHVRNNLLAKSLWLCVLQTARAFQSALRDSLLTWRTAACAPAATSAVSPAAAAIAESAAPASPGSTSRERAAWSSVQTGWDKQPSPVLILLFFSLYRLLSLSLTHGSCQINELLKLSKLIVCSAKKINWPPSCAQETRNCLLSSHVNESKIAAYIAILP